jgi:hypothetical protein
MDFHLTPDHNLINDRTTDLHQKNYLIPQPLTRLTPEMPTRYLHIPTPFPTQLRNRIHECLLGFPPVGPAVARCIPVYPPIGIRIFPKVALYLRHLVGHVAAIEIHEIRMEYR